MDLRVLARPVTGPISAMLATAPFLRLRSRLLIGYRWTFPVWPRIGRKLLPRWITCVSQWRRVRLGFTTKDRVSVTRMLTASGEIMRFPCRRLRTLGKGLLTDRFCKILNKLFNIFDMFEWEASAWLTRSSPPMARAMSYRVWPLLRRPRQPLLPHGRLCAWSMVRSVWSSTGKTATCCFRAPRKWKMADDLVTLSCTR